ncbi:MAG: flagellar protein FlaG [Burkholderiaceae bacterium]|nr:MAG: flagellar protein FlaG [Burkholderiaceae bacterium]
MHEGMGMDKVNNVKSAIASANLDANNSKSVKLAEGRSSSTPKATPVTQGIQTKLDISLKNKSVATTKTLAETLKTNEEKVRAAVKEINNELEKLQSELGFSVDKVANDVVITVKRKESGEIVRQIPSETVLKLAHNLEKLKGVLLDEKL